MSLVGLPEKWRFQVWNDANEDLKVGLYWRGQKLDSTGGLVYGEWTAAVGTEEGDGTAGTDFVWRDGTDTPTPTKVVGDGLYNPPGNDGATADDGLVDNDTDKWLGLDGWWKIKTPSSGPIGANGNFMIFFQSYNDATSASASSAGWPEDGTGIVVASAFLFTDDTDFIRGGTFSV